MLTSGLQTSGRSGRERVLLQQLHQRQEGVRQVEGGARAGGHGQEGARRQTFPQLRAARGEAAQEDHLQEGPRQHRKGEGVQKVSEPDTVDSGNHNIIVLLRPVSFFSGGGDFCPTFSTQCST